MKNVILWLKKPSSVWILLAAVAVLLIAIGMRAGLNSSEWASWVQAIGSIGAIAGSFALARKEAQSASAGQKGADLLRAYELAVAADFLAHEVERALTDVLKKMEMRRARKNAIGNERLLQIQEALVNFTHQNLSPLLLKQMLILQREVAYSLTAIRELGKRTALDKRIYNAQIRLQRVESCRYQINGQVGDYAQQLVRHGVLA